MFAQCSVHSVNFRMAFVRRHWGVHVYLQLPRLQPFLWIHHSFLWKQLKGAVSNTCTAQVLFQCCCFSRNIYTYISLGSPRKIFTFVWYILLHTFIRSKYPKNKWFYTETNFTVLYRARIDMMTWSLWLNSPKQWYSKSIWICLRCFDPLDIFLSKIRGYFTVWPNWYFD